MKSAVRESIGSADIPATMLAVVFTAQDHFTLRDVPTPRPGPREVLVRVRASMVCASDAKILAGRFPGIRLKAARENENSQPMQSTPRMPELPQHGERLKPAEDLLDPFPLSLADSVDVFLY